MRDVWRSRPRSRKQCAPNSTVSRRSTQHGTAETLYTDGDLTLAAYAAALQVVTSYSSIDRQPLDRDLYRARQK